MGLNELIRAKTQRPCYRVRINGSIELIKVESVQIESDFDRSSASATVTCAAKRNVQPNDEIVIEQGYDGYMRRTFTGYVDDVDREAFPNKFVIAARDVLKRAIDNYLVEEIEYDSVQAEDIVKDLLEKSGIYNYSLDTTNFTVGDVNPAKFSLISAMDAIKAIADLIGWRVWATKGGTVKFAKVYPKPSTEYKWLYTKDPTFGSQSGIIRVTRSFTDINLRNWVEVWGWTNPITGETIEAVRSADSPFVPSPPRYRKCVVSSEIIDTQSMADWIAERILNDLNCLLERGDVEIQGNPKLNVGDTIRITEDWTDQSSGVNYFIYGFSSRMDGSGNYSMTLQVRGGKLAPPYPGGQPPVADLVISQIGWGDPTWVVYADASGSYDPDGTIVSYDIDWGDATAHATTVRANHIYAGAVGTQYTITLTVTDNDGLTGTCSKTITIGQSGGGSTAYDRVLYISVENGAGSGEALGSPDSGNTWYSSGDLGTRVLQVTVSNAEDEGYAWFSGENGKLWKTIDYCDTMTLVYTFASAVRALWLNRSDTNDLVVGLNNGDVYRSFDYGISWTKIGDFEGPVRWVISYSYAPNHIVVAGGTTTAWLRETIDGGNSWRLVTLPGLESIYDGCIAHFLFSHQWGVIGHTDSSPVRHSIDYGLTWTSPTGITDQNLNSISWSPYDENQKITGGEGGIDIWRTDDGLTYSDVGDLITISGTKVTKVLIEPYFWGTVFAGCDDDAELSFDLGATWKQLKDVTGTVTDIDLGPLIPVGEDTVLVATSVNGVYRTENWTATVPTWVIVNSGLGVTTCNDLIKDPFNVGTYWLITTDGLYKTEDDGDSWVQNTTIPTPESSGRTPEYMGICYGASDGVIYVSYSALGGSGNDRGYLLKTIDGGITWNSLKIPGKLSFPDDASTNLTSLCVSLEDDNLVYLSGQWVGRIRAWKINWPSTVTEIHYVAQTAVTYHIHSPRYYDDWVWLFGYWGTDDQIEKSIDEGSSWVDAGNFGVIYVHALNSHYANYSDVIVGLDKKLYEATNGVAPWTEIADLTTIEDHIVCISRKPTDVDYIIIGVNSGTVENPSKIWLTKDKGQTWQDKTGIIPYNCGQIRAIAGPWNEDTTSFGP